MTMNIAACCNGGRRLTYHVDINGTETLLFVETKLDGSEAPVMMNGKASGETMAITRVDAHHASTVLRMNGKPFGTSQATLSADGRTLTVLDDFSSSVGDPQVGDGLAVAVIRARVRALATRARCRDLMPRRPGEGNGHVPTERLRRALTCRTSAGVGRAAAWARSG